MEDLSKKSIVERFEILGWAPMPTAKHFYMLNKQLHFKFPNYDLYVEDNYSYNKPKWHNRVGIASTEAKSTSDNGGQGISEGSTESHIEIVMDERQANEINDLLSSRSPIHQQGQQTFIKPQVSINTSDTQITKLKSKKNKTPGNFRLVETSCPECLSKLVTDEFGILRCSGDKLQVWTKEFIKYEQMGQPQKTGYLKKYNDSSMFLELYERWSYIDEKGNRQQFDCVYTNKLANPISRYRTSLPDPCLVLTIEQSLGRTLTEEEKANETPIYRKGKAFFEDFELGRQIVKIPQLIYPNDFL